MTSRRMALIGATVAFVITAGAAAQVPSTTIGPIEKRAKPITPENPIPRRIHSVNPTYPPEVTALGASGRVTLRVVLNEFGRVAEVRRINLPILGFSQKATLDALGTKTATEAVLRAAAEAVEQWQYDPPADGPIAFNVTFTLAPPATFTFTSQDAGGSGMSLQETIRVTGGVAAAPPPPPPPPPGGSTNAAFAGAVRVGGDVRPPMQIAKVNPVYPAEAQANRIQGVVILEAIIGTDGRVADARILRSIPALDQAAIDAVRQWQYLPTLMNGTPVPVIMTVTVQFTLA